jgi:hypothetical protein
MKFWTRDRRRKTDAAQAPGGSRWHGHFGCLLYRAGETFNGDKMNAYPAGSVTTGLPIAAGENALSCLVLRR